jgi:hypothetical protein
LRGSFTYSLQERLVKTLPVLEHGGVHLKILLHPLRNLLGLGQHGLFRHGAHGIEEPLGGLCEP